MESQLAAHSSWRNTSADSDNPTHVFAHASVSRTGGAVYASFTDGRGEPGVAHVARRKPLFHCHTHRHSVSRWHATAHQPV